MIPKDGAFAGNAGHIREVDFYDGIRRYDGLAWKGGELMIFGATIMFLLLCAHTINIRGVCDFK